MLLVRQFYDFSVKLAWNGSVMADRTRLSWWRATSDDLVSVCNKLTVEVVRPEFLFGQSIWRWVFQVLLSPQSFPAEWSFQIVELLNHHFGNQTFLFCQQRVMSTWRIVFWTMRKSAKVYNYHRKLKWQESTTSWKVRECNDGRQYEIMKKAAIDLQCKLNGKLNSCLGLYSV